jgi:2-polyprenyl-3-methyl-5-hydroxy-6-metoxy-1,4-benzoquinol methylase
MSVFDRVFGGVARFAAEAPWSRRLALRLLREVDAVRETVVDRAPVVSDAHGSADLVFVCADPEALVPPATQRRLLAGLEASGLDVLFPVSNAASDAALLRAPTFAYATPAEIAETASLMAGSGEGIAPVDGVGAPVFAIRRRLLDSLPPGISLAEAGRRGRAAVDRDAFVHRYGAMDSSEREDLVARVPRGARRVLDVGCARGAAAGKLREREVAEIFGIEPDPACAAEASTRYDVMRNDSLFEIEEAWDGFFDAVLFGDVLEHLDDPAAALSKVRPWLSPSGRLIATVPNVGTVSVVADLLAGRFDVVPYSTLSGTHVNFFTRASLCAMLSDCGYEVEEIAALPGMPTPATAALLERLCRDAGVCPDLASPELLVVARPRRGESTPS